jgi:hypothetical protein
MIVQVRRGATAEALAWKGLEGTFFVDLTTKLVYVHDGVTVGGTLIGGLSQTAINQLIDTKLAAFEVAVADVNGLTEALATIPAKATGEEVIEGTDDAKYVTAASLLALLNDIGFTKEPGGEWKLDAGTVAP